MIRPCHVALAFGLIAVACRDVPQATSPVRLLADAQSQPNSHNPTWWDKYLFLSQNGALRGGDPTASKIFGNVDVSNECGPQSETFIALNPNLTRQLTAGSN